MKKLLLSLLLLLTMMPAAIFAQQQQQRMVIWLKNGSKVYVDLSEDPHTKFTAPGQLTLTTSSQTLSYQLTDVIRYTFEGSSTDIGKPKSGDMGFRQNGESVELYNLPAGLDLQLYDLSGKMLSSQRSKGGGETVAFSLAGYPAGVYIVKIGDQSLKITKR